MGKIAKGAGRVLGLRPDTGAGNAEMAAATKAQREALARMDAIGVPSIEAQQISLQLPELILSSPDERLTGTAFEGIELDPRLREAATDVLEDLRLRTQSGLTPEDRDQFEDLRETIAADEQARQGQILQSMAERGALDSGAQLAAQLSSSQASTDRASKSGRDIAAEASRAKREALASRGQLAQQLEASDYSRAANLAGKKDAISQYNAALASRDTGSRQQAAQQKANIMNQQQMHNKGLIQQEYQNKIAKAGGAAAQLGNIAATSMQQAQAQAGKAAQKQAGMFAAFGKPVLGLGQKAISGASMGMGGADGGIKYEDGGMSYGYEDEEARMSKGNPAEFKEEPYKAKEQVLRRRAAKRAAPKEKSFDDYQEEGHGLLKQADDKFLGGALSSLAGGLLFGEEETPTKAPTERPIERVAKKRAQVKDAPKKKAKKKESDPQMEFKNPLGNVKASAMRQSIPDMGASVGSGMDFKYIPTTDTTLPNQYFAGGIAALAPMLAGAAGGGGGAAGGAGKLGGMMGGGGGKSKGVDPETQKAMFGNPLDGIDTGDLAQDIPEMGSQVEGGPDSEYNPVSDDGDSLALAEQMKGALGRDPSNPENTAAAMKETSDSIEAIKEKAFQEELARPDEEEYAQGGVEEYKMNGYEEGGAEQTDGRITDGETYAGDMISDKVNAGEMVLNLDQQELLNERMQRLADLERLLAGSQGEDMLGEEEEEERSDEKVAAGKAEVDEDQQAALMDVMRGEKDVEELPKTSIVTDYTGNLLNKIGYKR